MPPSSESEPRSVLAVLGDLHRKCHAHGKAFQRTFGVPITPFIDIGFDVVAFDAWLGVPDDRSTEDVVRERFGDDAVALIYRLI